MKYDEIDGALYLLEVFKEREEQMFYELEAHRRFVKNIYEHMSLRKACECGCYKAYEKEYEKLHQ